MKQRTKLNIDGIERGRANDTPQVCVGERALWCSRGIISIGFVDSESTGNGDKKFHVLLVCAVEM